MSWEDRDYAGAGRGFGRPGGDWQGIRPSFENPLSWALSIFRVGGIHVRIHIIFLLFILVQLARSLAEADEGTSVPVSVMLTGVMLAALFTIVLLHEFGHCIACRRTGGSANEILMWPLGGLAYCQPPNQWRAHLWTVLGGPLVNVFLGLLLVPLLGLITQRWWGVALPNPFDISAGLYAQEVSTSRVHQTLYLINVMNFVLLAFNLLPIFPLDGGRIVQSLLWPKLGYVRSMRIAVYTGYIGAIALGVVGMVMAHWLLIVIALFGGFTCFQTLRQLSWTEEMMGFEDDTYAQSLFDERKDKPSKAEQRRAERAERQRAEAEARAKKDAAEIDRILAKIKEQGIGSLTPPEKRRLQQETDRQQESE